MQLNLDLAFKTTLSGPEFRLVTLALAGKLKEQDEIEAARTLNKKFLEARTRELEAAAENSRATLRSAQGKSHDQDKTDQTSDSKPEEGGAGVGPS